jgi:hypothetical protein
MRKQPATEPDEWSTGKAMVRKSVRSERIWLVRIFTQSRRELDWEVDCLRREIELFGGPFDARVKAFFVLRFLGEFVRKASAPSVSKKNKGEALCVSSGSAAPREKNSDLIP